MRVVLDGHRTSGPEGVARPSCRTSVVSQKLLTRVRLAVLTRDSGSRLRPCSLLLRAVH